jgi:hypothetical protein
MSKSKQGNGVQATSGIAMGPIDTYRYPLLSFPDKKALSTNDSHNFPPSYKKAYPIVDEGVLRCWGMRRYEVGGVEVIGWEVGMEKA